MPVQSSLHFGVQTELNFEPCAFCGAPGEKLCDYILGYDIPGFSTEEARSGKTGVELRSVIAGRKPVTCDTSFCARCGKVLSRVFLDGVRNGRRAGWTDTVDHCLLHKNLDPPTDIRIVTAAEIEKARASIASAIALLRPTLPTRTGDNVIVMPVLRPRP